MTAKTDALTHQDKEVLRAADCLVQILAAVRAGDDVEACAASRRR